MKACSGIPTTEYSTISAFIRHISKPSLTRSTTTGGQQGTIMDVLFKSELSSLLRFYMLYPRVHFTAYIQHVGCAAEAPNTDLHRVTSRDSLNRHFHYTTYSSHRLLIFRSTLHFVAFVIYPYGHTQHFPFPHSNLTD